MGSQSIIASSLPIGAQPNQNPNKGCCAECYSSTTGNPFSNNPISVPDVEPVQVCAQNSQRKEIIIQNTGTETVYIGLGYSPSTTAYAFALSPCSTNDDGTGAAWVSDMWQGSIFVISASGGSNVVVTELQ